MTYAEEQLAQAERAAVAAQREVDAAESELTTLESEVGLAAIRAFVTDEGDQAAVLAAGDPTKALRMEELRAQATQTDLDLIEVLRVAREDLDVRRAEAVETAAAADTIRRESGEQLAELQADQAAQSRLTSAAEDRLDHLLGERAALATLGQDLAAGEADTDALARQLAASPTQTPAPTVAPPTLVGEDDIAYAGSGIYVHVSIVDEIRQLLIDAAARRGEPGRWWLPEPGRPDRRSPQQLRHVQLRHLRDAVQPVQPTHGPPRSIDARAGPRHRLHLQRQPDHLPLRPRMELARGQRPRLRPDQPAQRTLALVDQRSLTAGCRQCGQAPVR